MINKDVRKFLAHKNGNEILIWSWNKPPSIRNKTTFRAVAAAWTKEPSPMVKNAWIPCAYSVADADKGATLKYQMQNIAGGFNKIFWLVCTRCVGQQHRGNYHFNIHSPPKTTYAQFFVR